MDGCAPRGRLPGSPACTPQPAAQLQTAAAAAVGSHRDNMKPTSAATAACNYEASPVSMHRHAHHTLPTRADRAAALSTHLCIDHLCPCVLDASHERLRPGGVQVDWRLGLAAEGVAPAQGVSKRGTAQHISVRDQLTAARTALVHDHRCVWQASTAQQTAPAFPPIPGVSCCTVLNVPVSEPCCTPPLTAPFCPPSTCDSSGRMVTPAWPPMTGRDTSLGS